MSVRSEHSNPLSAQVGDRQGTPLFQRRLVSPWGDRAVNAVRLKAWRGTAPLPRSRTLI